MLALCGGATFALVWCVMGSSPAASSRLSVRRQPRPGLGRAHSPIEDPRQRLAVCVAACTVAGWLVAGLAGVALGVPAGCGLSWWMSRLESPSQKRAREEITRDLPLAADLMCACVLAGRPLDEAVRLVSAAVGGSLGARLDRVTARLALGSDPLTEWRRAADDPQLAALARTMVRALESGAPIGVALSRLAEDRRRERRTQTQLRARKVSVRAAGPLAACFLPAFMLIGIVPTIAGAFSNLVL